jgi:hypothetical protein
MIIPNPRHLFEDCLPKLEEGEEEIFYPHPIYDLSCNQIGLIYPGETLTYYSYSTLADKCNVNDLKNYKTSAPRLKIIAQCFAGHTDIPFRTVPLDGNPYNTTASNLLYPKSFNKVANENYHNFKQRTIQYMLERDKKLEAKGIPPIMYWGLQKLVHPFRNEYTNVTGYNLSLDDNGIPKMFGKDKPTEKIKVIKKKRKYRTKEEISKLRVMVRDMVNSGIAKKEAAKKLGLSISELNYYYVSKDYVNKSWTKNSK